MRLSSTYPEPCEHEPQQARGSKTPALRDHWGEASGGISSLRGGSPAGALAGAAGSSTVYLARMRA